MSPIRDLINVSVIEALKATIEEARGNEVFFLARADEHKIVQEVTPLARGHDRAVAALLQVAAQGDVIIHNHPSGVLTPSNADLRLASEYGNMGVGFFIINNRVDDIYVVVEAFSKEKLAQLDSSRISGLLAESGLIARNLKGFEKRPEQLRMIAAASTAFNESRLALVEAGTGTGKSLAYLIPAIYWAVQNKQRVVISTNTINLQEQLINKDIPFLKSVLGLPFKAVLIKGRNNYVCLSKIESLKTEGELLTEAEERQELGTIFEWSRTTGDGSRSDLSIIPTPAVWEKVACESDNCARIRCEFYSRCFFYNARREATSADLLVANHHLLFADLAVRGETRSYSDVAVLPPYSRVILDEAHNVEEIATEYFGIQVSRYGLTRLLGRFYSLRDRERMREKGLLPYLLVKMRSFENQIDLPLYSRIHSHIQSNLIVQKENLSFVAGNVFDELAVFFESLAENEAGGELKIRFTSGLCEKEEWKDCVLGPVQQLLSEMREFHQQLLSLEKSLDLLPEPVLENLIPQTVELKALTDRIEATAAALGEIFGPPAEEKVRWIELRSSRSGKLMTLKQAPLNVSELLRERLFAKYQTVILTSATLTTEGRFDYIKRQLGLDQISAPRLLELALSSSFNYREQVIIGIPLGIPRPEDPTFLQILNQLLSRSISISEGRALVLFTSYSLLRRSYQELLEPLRAMGIRVLKQGDAPRHRLTEIFKSDKTSVLFATDSFWEGVDVSGDALENVVLTKLPFSVPREPIVEAKVEAIARQGGNPFLDYTVPQAVIKFKQGFGRLIRSKADYGSIMIFDRRIIEKSYGKSFLNSLPECRTVKGDVELVFDEVSRFFQAHRSKLSMKSELGEAGKRRRGKKEGIGDKD
jgi:ATP-dependent DNA helicase DinG